MVHTGVIKWFNDKKGYGFIFKPEDVSGEPINNNEDIFVHQTAVIDQVTEGDNVEFELTDSNKGLRAVNVRKIAGSAGGSNSHQE